MVIKSREEDRVFADRIDKLCQAMACQEQPERYEQLMLSLEHVLQEYIRYRQARNGGMHPAR
ncbi:MAG: hypothetical protein P4N59_16865 [Negativicutes bacterium]|nr:hypothetical protein [Negativicutes bacterium]